MNNQVTNHEVSETLLRGRWLRLAQAGWLLVSLLVAGICITALVLLYADHRTFALTLNTPELESPAFAKYYIGINAIFAAVCILIATIIFWRRSDDGMALLTALMIMVFGTFGYNA